MSDDDSTLTCSLCPYVPSAAVSPRAFLATSCSAVPSHLLPSCTALTACLEKRKCCISAIIRTHLMNNTPHDSTSSLLFTIQFYYNNHKVIILSTLTATLELKKVKHSERDEINGKLLIEFISPAARYE